jgi:Ribbon-helix-helix protein, copG family
MRRTNIYLSDEQLAALRAVASERDVPVAALVRQAVDAWLESEGVRVLPEDEWQRRFDALLRRRDEVAAGLEVSEEDVERDVMEAVREVRRARAARRR